MEQSLGSRFVYTSPRSLGEQLVGFGIVCLVASLVSIFEKSVFEFGIEWLSTLRQASWALDSFTHHCLNLLAQGSATLAFWSLWRRYSLRLLRLELTLFLSMLLLKTVWSCTLFIGHETFFSLLTLLLWLSVAVLLGALFWKKKKIAGLFFFFPLVWIFYLISTNMVLCIANP